MCECLPKMQTKSAPLPPSVSLTFGQRALKNASCVTAADQATSQAGVGASLRC